MFVFTLFLALSFLATLYAAVLLFFGIQKMKHLQDVPPIRDDKGPKVSLIVPACNEQENISQAVTSFLEQDYNNLELIIINDRSVDKTGEILRTIQEKHDRLKIYDIEVLPEGWLGKSHAMQFGAEHATGEYLVFTDGDIILEKTTISRAVNRMISMGLDHLCLVFKNIANGWLLNSLILDSGGGLFLLFQPWNAANKKSKAFMGVGAFNMVKTTSYLGVGGHTTFRMHPIDDLMLGKKLKRAGYTQECLLGYEFVAVRWYESLGAMIDGLMKNVFAVINFRILYLPGLLFSIFVIGILPLWGSVFASGVGAVLSWLTIVLRICLLFVGGRALQLSLVTVLGALLAPHITFYIALKAAFLALKNDGIFWRGTHYPLAALKKNEPLIF